MNREQLLKYITAGASGAEGGAIADIKAQNEEKAKNSDMARLAAQLKDPNSPLAKVVGQTGSIKSGDASVSAGNVKGLMNIGPQQAKTFQHTAEETFKNLKNQTDTSRSTLDLLDAGEKGNQAADRQALLSEAAFALTGAGGSRAFGQVIDHLSGGQTANMDAQQRLNWLNNTPNVPTLQPAYRDALRDSVYTRLGQMGNQASQAKQQLLSLGPQMAPNTDYGSLVSAYSGPIEQNINNLNSRYADYQQKKQSQAGSPNGAPDNSNLGKIKNGLASIIPGIFGKSQGQAPQQTMTAQAPQQPQSQSVPSQAAQLPQQPAPQQQQSTPSAQPAQSQAQPQVNSPQGQPQTMRVRDKKSGMTGTVPANEFDPTVYERIQ